MRFTFQVGPSSVECLTDRQAFILTSVTSANFATLFGGITLSIVVGVYGNSSEEELQSVIDLFKMLL
jgi:hypothetical protein